MTTGAAELAIFKTLLDLTGDCIFVCRADTLQLTYANRGAAEQVGYARDELLTMTKAEVNAELDEKAFRARLAPLLDGTQKVVRFESRHRRRDGSTVPVQLTVRVAELGGQTQFISSALDTTLRLQLQRSDALNRAVLASAADGILVIDERGILESFNPSAERIFGYAAAEIVGKNVSLLMPPPHRAAHDGYLASYLATGKKKVIDATVEVEALRKDGAPFPLELSVSELRVGEQRLFAGIARDLSAQKRAQRAMANLQGAMDEHSIVAITDPRGRIEYVNDKFCAISKYSREELLG